MRSFFETQQFSQDEIMALFAETSRLKLIPSKLFGNFLIGKIVALLFYEPSTRTRLSFEAAILRSGGQVMSTENAKEFSSAAKGETIEDTAKIVGQYADAIVIRHYEIGAAKRAAAVSDVPIINAGDGTGQHPTQALLDAFTIYERFGRLDNLRIQCIGDMANGRTVRSLAYLLGKWPGNELIFTSPKSLRMSADILEYLDRHDVKYRETEEICFDADVNYATRVQKERLNSIEEYEAVRGKHIITAAIADRFPKDSIIMHPLPRVDEIAPEVDSNPRAVYFEQAGNGLFVRATLLRMLLAA